MSQRRGEISASGGRQGGKPPTDDAGADGAERCEEGQLLNAARHHAQPDEPRYHGHAHEELLWGRGLENRWWSWFAQSFRRAGVLCMKAPACCRRRHSPPKTVAKRRRRAGQAARQGMPPAHLPLELVDAAEDERQALMQRVGARDVVAQNVLHLGVCEGGGSAEQPLLFRP